MLTELKITIRQLAMQRTFALSAIATLAVGVGATTAIFSMVNATLLRPLPYPGSENLYTLNTAFADGRWSSGRVAFAYIEYILESAPSVAGVAAFREFEDVILTDQGENRQALVHGVSEGFFDLFGLAMAEGRAFVPEDHADPPVAVISHRLWNEVFRADPATVGRSVRFQTGPVTVVGVAPPDFDVPQGTDVWTSMPPPPATAGHNYQAYLRVHPGTSVELLQSEIAPVLAAVAETSPLTAKGRTFVVRPLVTAIVGDLGPILLVLLGGAAVLLLIGSVNVAMLVLGRGAARTREVAVRAALGGDRWSIVRRFLLESLVLATAGTVAGLGLAWLGVQGLLAYEASQLPRLDRVPFDMRVLLFTGVVLVATTLLTGLFPALRLATPDIRGLLNESGRSRTRARGTHRMLSGLVVAEIAFAIVLVAGAGWLLRSYVNLSRTDPGFDVESRLVFTAFLDGSTWAPRRVVIQGPDGGPMWWPEVGSDRGPLTWLEAVAERLQASGQVTSVGSASVFPLGRDWDSGQYVAVPGEPYDPEHLETARMRLVSPTFFDAMGTRLLAGRPFSAREVSVRDVRVREDVLVAIVNEAFVRRYLPQRDPLSTSFAWGFPVVDLDNAVQIVGIVEDVKYGSLREEPEPIFYLPSTGDRQSVVVATTLDDPRSLIPAVRAEVGAVDPSIPITVEAFGDIVAAQMVRHRIGLALMALFAAISLALAAVGIYGVIAHVTGQRAGELATRMALGATPSDVRALVMRQATTLALSGGLVGLGTAYFAGSVAVSRLYQVRATDPTILAAAVAAVIGITFLAFLVPALRAARRQPMDALGAE